MLELTNRQLWEIATTSADTQEAMEAAYLLEERGGRGSELFELKNKMLQKRVTEINEETSKENVLIPKIASGFFIFSTLLMVTAALVLLYELKLEYLLETPKFIVLGIFLLVIRSFFMFKAGGGVQWARYLMLYGFIVVYSIAFILGYPGLLKFIFLEDLYFGIIFLTHFLVECLGLFLVFIAFRN